MLYTIIMWACLDCDGTHMCTNIGRVAYVIFVCCCYYCRRRHHRRQQRWHTTQYSWEWLTFAANPYGTLYNLVAFLPSKWPYSLSFIRSVTLCVFNIISRFEHFQTLSIVWRALILFLFLRPMYIVYALENIVVVDWIAAIVIRDSILFLHLFCTL